MQKVLALIDAQNLWYTPKNDWNKKLDYKKLYSLLKKENPDQKIEPYIYLILDPLVSSDAFISLLRCIGYVPRIKFIFQSDDKEFSNTDWSTDMVREGRNLIQDGDYTSVVVASGNYAFIDLFNYAGMLGKTTNLFCFEKDYSEKFSQKVDKITFLDKNVCF